MWLVWARSPKHPCRASQLHGTSPASHERQPTCNMGKGVGGENPRVNIISIITLSQLCTASVLQQGLPTSPTCKWPCQHPPGALLQNRSPSSACDLLSTPTPENVIGLKREHLQCTFLRISKYTNPTECDEDKQLPDTVREAGCQRIDIGQSGGQGQGGGLASTSPFRFDLKRSVTPCQEAPHDAT